MSYNAQLQENNADLQEILDTVNALPEVGDGVELPELTNPGTAGDMAEGKELIDSNGNVVTGTLKDDGLGFSSTNVTVSGLAADTLVQVGAHVAEDKIIRTGTNVTLTMESKAFGDASVDDVAEGKTFTSAAGLKKTGTSKAVDTSDATATAEQMAQGATAYVNGEKITGTIYDNGTNDTSYTIDELSSFAGGTVIQLSGTNITDKIIRAGSKINGNISAKEFGDATAEDVAKGKTFTSAAGLLAVGTKEENDGARTVFVTVNTVLTVYYFDADKVLQSVTGQATVEALNGVFYFHKSPNNPYACVGDYILQAIGESYYIAMFLGDTGSLTIESGSGTGGGS